MRNGGNGVITVMRPLEESPSFLYLPALSAPVVRGAGHGIISLSFIYLILFLSTLLCQTQHMAPHNLSIS